MDVEIVKNGKTLRIPQIGWEALGVIEDAREGAAKYQARIAAEKAAEAERKAKIEAERLADPVAEAARRKAVVASALGKFRAPASPEPEAAPLAERTTPPLPAGFVSLDPRRVVPPERIAPIGPRLAAKCGLSPKVVEPVPPRAATIPKAPPKPFPIEDGDTDYGFTQLAAAAAACVSEEHREIFGRALICSVSVERITIEQMHDLMDRVAVPPAAPRPRAYEPLRHDRAPPPSAPAKAATSGPEPCQTLDAPARDWHELYDMAEAVLLHPERREAFEQAVIASLAEGRIGPAQRDRFWDMIDGVPLPEKPPKKPRKPQQPTKPRRKIHGAPINARPMDRNLKARILFAARILKRRTEKGKHYGKITGKTYDVLVALLLKFHNSKSGICFPGYERIAAAASCCHRTVATAINALESCGILTWVNRTQTVTINGFTQVIRTSNSYAFHLPEFAKCKNCSGTEGQEAHPDKASRSKMEKSDTSIEKGGQPIAAAVASLSPF